MRGIGFLSVRNVLNGDCISPISGMLFCRVWTLSGRISLACPPHSLFHAAILNFRSLRFLLLIPFISQHIHILSHPFPLLFLFYVLFVFIQSYLYFCTFSPSHSAHFSAYSSYSFSSLSFAFLFYVLLFYSHLLIFFFQF